MMYFAVYHLENIHISLCGLFWKTLSSAFICYS